MTAKSGFELAQMMLDENVPLPSMDKLVNMTLLEVAEGRALFEAVADHNHLNPMGGVHGGFVASVLDSACGFATFTSLPAGQAFTSIDLAIKFMRPIPRNQRLSCEGIVQKPGRRVVFVEAWLRDEDGKLLAHATSSCAVFDLA